MRTPHTIGGRGRSPRLRRGFGGPAGRPVRVRYALYIAGILAVLSTGVFGYYVVSFSRLIDARLSGERERTLPRVYARPLVLRLGQAVSRQELVALLNGLGYAQRAAVESPGEFAIDRNAIAILPRAVDVGGTIRVSFTSRATVIQRIEVTGRGRRDAVQLDAPLLTALITGGDREKRRSVPLSSIPTSCSRRCWRLKIRASTRIPASIPSESSRPR